MDSESNLTVIDLFCGCGGFSLGAALAGFHVVCGVDLDTLAIASHSKNFPNSIHLSSDISGLTSDSLLSAASVEGGQLDGIIGGPPCQGFSTMGKGQTDDIRNTLFADFFRIVSETQPRFYLCENVPGIMRDAYTHVRSEALDRVKGAYQQFAPVVIKASEYGAPTTRTRVFFLGVRKDVKNMPVSSSFLSPVSTVAPVTVRHALAGLPAYVSPNWQDTDQQWVELGRAPDGIYGEYIRTLIDGVGDPLSCRSLLNDRLVSGCIGTRHTPDVVRRFHAVPQGGVDRVSRAPRLHLDGFCPTLRAGTGSDRGSYQAVRPIHPTEDRVITPREAARLQGFPDWFQFHATKWHSFRQIGNSISPIVAAKLLKSISINVLGEKEGSNEQ